MAITLSSMAVRPAVCAQLGAPRRSARATARRAVIAMADKPKFTMPEVNVPEVSFDKEAIKENALMMKEKAVELTGDASEYWEKLEDKPTAVALGFAALFALYTGATMIDAIDQLPLVGGFFELVGIGASGFFAYNILSSSDGREQFLSSIKETFDKISLK